MNRTLAVACLHVSIVALALSACSFEDTRDDHCVNMECGPGKTCVDGFCVDRDDPNGRLDAGDGPSTGSMGSPVTTPDAGGTRPDAGTTMMPPADAGMSMMPVDAGTAMPASCQEGDTRACMLPGSTAERCRTGNRACVNGMFGECVPSETPSAEECNGVDDDCDGKTDEGADENCYPDGVMGCTLAAGRLPDCDGLCSVGRRMCRNGVLEACTGAITPQQEICTTSGASADENCNGEIDETCSCAAGEMRSCYTDVPGTINVGICRAGSQVCTNGALGPCMGAVVPRDESCMNESTDDDCNGVIDDIASRGTPCVVASSMGVCRTGIFQCQGSRPELTCVTPMPSDETCNGVDDDCDGMADETFQLETDSANCGACGRRCEAGQTCCSGRCTDLMLDATSCGTCGNACAAGQSCCGGMCLDTATDEAHCGMCGRACADGETCCGGSCVNTETDRMHCGECGGACTTGVQPGCCSGACVDLVSQDNCGMCGRRCGVLDGGVTCECGMTADGTLCIAPLLGVCL